MAVLLLALTASGGNLDIVGATTLRLLDPTLTGSGIAVAQPEARASTNPPPQFQVSPFAVGRPVGSITYISELGTSAEFTNSVGRESSHANSVGWWFYGSNSGVAPGVTMVDNYDANHFHTNCISNPLQPAVTSSVVNQSFIFPNLTTNQQRALDTEFDNYAARHNVLFVSGAGNGAGNGNNGYVNAPATCYNGIGVAVIDAASSIGPTRDNGRCKPDITAPGGATSFSAALVSGAAAILLQAANRGDGGPGTASEAADIRSVKALLLNGAVKPTNWTHTPSGPLDYKYGAGVLNVLNSHQQLAGGKRAPIETTTHAIGGAHPPGSNTSNILSLLGWNLDSLGSTITKDAVHHYYFALTNTVHGSYTMTATLVWNRQFNASSPAALDLFLYDMSGNLVTSSVSTVDNVEHIHLPQLAPGRYDLQVFKKGGLGNSGSETYALAFESFTMSLAIARSQTEVVLSWPVAPEGFTLQVTTNLNALAWETATAPSSIVAGRNRVILPAPAPTAFYRLRRP